jgi:hypothetical protein
MTRALLERQGPPYECGMGREEDDGLPACTDKE